MIPSSDSGAVIGISTFRFRVGEEDAAGFGGSGWDGPGSGAAGAGEGSDSGIAPGDAAGLGGAGRYGAADLWPAFNSTVRRLDQECFGPLQWYPPKIPSETVFLPKSLTPFSDFQLPAFLLPDPVPRVPDSSMKAAAPVQKPEPKAAKVGQRRNPHILAQVRGERTP
jgi:hypothetical protein